MNINLIDDDNLTAFIDACMEGNIKIFFKSDQNNKLLDKIF